MNEARNLLLDRTAWLYTKLYDGPLFFFDLWSLAHFFSGFFLMLVLCATHQRRPFLKLSAMLVGYELLELLFVYVAVHAFHPETLKDQGTDIVVGWAGGSVANAFVRVGRTLSQPTRDALVRHAAALLTALAIAFEWVGHYGYRYDRPFFNSRGLCWWAFLLWSLALLGVSEGYAFFEARTASVRKALFLTLIGYAVGFVVVEHLGYFELGIHEIGHVNRTALVFDLAHGTRGLHVFYTLAPAIGVAVFAGIRAVLRRATMPLESAAG